MSYASYNAFFKTLFFCISVSGYEISVWYEPHSNKSSSDPDVMLPERVISPNLSALIQPSGELVYMTVMLSTSLLRRL